MRLALHFGLAATLAAWCAIPCLAQTDTKQPEGRRSSERIQGKTLFEWAKDLKESRDPYVLEKALAVLKVYGPAAREEVPAIIKALSNKDAGVRVNAVITLGFVGMKEEHRRDGVAALNALLRDQQGIVRFQAARALARLGPDAHSALPNLIFAVKDQTTWEIRAAAANALGSVAWDSNGYDRAAWLAVLPALSDPCSEVRCEAIRALLRFGTPFKIDDKSREIQALQTLQTDKNEKVAIWARVAVMRITKVSEKDLAAIAKLLHSPRPEARINAAQALGTVGMEAKAHVADLVDALEDKDPEVVFWCCVALGQIKEGGDRVVAALKPLMQNPDPKIQAAAKEAVEKMGGEKANK